MQQSGGFAAAAGKQSSRAAYRLHMCVKLPWTKLIQEAVLMIPLQSLLARVDTIIWGPARVSVYKGMNAKSG